MTERTRTHAHTNCKTSSRRRESKRWPSENTLTHHLRNNTSKQSPRSLILKLCINNTIDVGVTESSNTNLDDDVFKNSSSIGACGEFCYCVFAVCSIHGLTGKIDRTMLFSVRKDLQSNQFVTKDFIWISHSCWRNANFRQHPWSYHGN